MFKDLSQGIKISIARSITTSFEQYMISIEWDEKRFSMQNFVNEWRDYINNHSSWFNQISDEMKENPQFHEELADKINVAIEKIFTEEPTEAQIEEINSLQKELKAEVSYSCKMEAKYVIDKMKEQLKKKQSN
ncbi:hypothetical protein F7731_09200 [Cytobacillus depressus]|uniref:Group-specific protein n=2 Tax=Cytobacillus depressus TaxID=1602942 RepID=A0A6L3V8R5_9BACI|nr:hypothetical protein [Cytobacillus depressus]KAB2336831.1 hypothetical protein F7731_09200 [Cytobacillus depressus]